MREQRELRNGHRAVVLWFTGLSGSGKTTVARALDRTLFTLGAQTFHLDGDNVRHGLNGDLSFSEIDRRENIRRVAEVAKMAFDHGAIVICTFISPFERDRDFARSLIPKDRFIEIYAQCDIEICKRRDPKGLYAKALGGKIVEFTGISSPYEAPAAADIVIEADLVSAEDAAEWIIEDLKRRELLGR